MQEVQRPWCEIVADLNRALKECSLSLRALANGAGCDYFAVRRFKKDGVLNRSKAALCLCRFYKISTGVPEKVQIKSIGTVIEAVQEVWDGSDAHAELMARLIRSTREFTVLHNEHNGRSKEA